MQGSGEVSSVGSPYGWYSQNMQDYSTGFVAIFDVLISANRSHQILTMLQDGHYLDDQTASKQLKTCFRAPILALEPVHAPDCDHLLVLNQ